MSEANGNWKLEHFDESQRQYVIQCLAKDMRLVDIVPFFISMFPKFGNDLPENLLKERLYERIRNHKRKNADEIAELRLTLTDESVEHIPMANPAYRLRLLHQIWDETPPKSALQDGDKKFKSNTKERLEILEQARLETQMAKEAGDMVTPQQGGETPVEKGSPRDVSPIELITGGRHVENGSTDPEEENTEKPDDQGTQSW